MDERLVESDEPLVESDERLNTFFDNRELDGGRRAQGRRRLPIFSDGQLDAIVAGSDGPLVWYAYPDWTA